MTTTSLHVLIYGFYSQEQEQEQEQETVKTYRLPMYGKPSNQLAVHGIQYDCIHGLYDLSVDLLKKEGRLQLTDPVVCVPQHIKHKMKTLYPDKTCKEYALIQNVYTSHYTNASIYHGYYVHVADYEDDYDITFNSDIELLDTGGAGHNMKHDCNLFIGTSLGHLTETEDIEDCHTLAKQISTVYNIPENFPTKEELQKELLLKCKSEEFTVVGKCRTITSQNMCYCCT